MTNLLPRSAFQAVALSIGVSALALSAPVAAQSSTTDEAKFEVFAPGAQPNDNKIDYSIWDEAMKNLVISMGPSLRETAGRPDGSIGTRRQYGHVSRYRLEGTRVMFSFLDAEIKSSFTVYREDLEATADKVDIQSLSRNEQLAYWINLHNVSMMEKIAYAWPIRQPREIKVGGVSLEDAKFITVEGIAMSPRDIREKIVYKHWSDPKVIYGFWRGDIGGPSIQREAFNADNVARLLERGARDFVNSLRGTQKLGSKLQVSETYKDAAPYFFPDFEQDVRTHIGKFADEDVRKILAETTMTEAVINEHDIADLAGGVREPSYNSVDIGGQFASTRIPQSMARLLAQRERKFEKIIREGRTGTVTFSNIKLPGEEEEDDDGQVD